MATITLSLTTTARQDQALARLLVRMNTERAAQTPPLRPIADVPAMLTGLVEQAIQDYLRQYRQEQKDMLAAGVDTATSAQIQQAATALGVTLP
jgi:hypothetical protein